MRIPILRSLALVAFATTLGITADAGAVTVCPGPNSEYGIDVSEFQGHINWGQVKADGKSFAIIRVSDGTGHFDPEFNANWDGAKAVGMIRGVYQFFEPGEDAVAQANLVVQHMGAFGPGDLPPMIDVEVTGGQSPATITAKIHQWVDVIHAATGRKALIYTGGWFWNPDVQSGDFTSYPLVDSYYCNNCCPNIASPWTQWAIWQYSSTGAVGGIGGNVDLDRFDGNLAELQTLAGGAIAPVDWSASFVSQSFPFANMRLNMTVNESVAADLVMKNSGAKAWSASTLLATTQPRDRASAFVAPDWISPNRLADCKGGAAPGNDCKFSFTFHAPDAPGDYKEFFGLVEEGVAWFSDPGQGGPPDNQLEAWIHVAEAEYHGDFVKQSYPLAPQAAMAAAGQKLDGWIELKNVGTATWKAGETKLAPTPRDKSSPLGAPDWLSPTRVSTLAQDVPPGAVGHFPLSLMAMAAGDFTQTFTLVEDGITWFGDAPKGGGPTDDFLRVHLVVTPGSPPDASGPPADLATLAPDDAAPSTDDAGLIADADLPVTGDGGIPADAASAVDAARQKIHPDAWSGGGDAAAGPILTGGCGCTVAAAPPPLGASSLGLLLLGLLILRTRRRSARTPG